ncbi:hypothetical protein HMPREF2550_03240 [Corynebacterium sp. HMSC074A01]|nr:hypothetical protein HMPREF2550_03240 [Corynebacterium sp. HMSC074A01]
MVGRMKRHTAIAASIVTTIGLTLAGCAEDDATVAETSETAESAESADTAESAETSAAEERDAGEAPTEHSEKAQELIAAFKEHYPDAEETDLNELYAQMEQANEDVPDDSDVKVDPPECDFSDETDELDTLATERSFGTLVSTTVGGSEPTEDDMGIPPMDATSIDLVVHDFANEKDAKTYLKGSDLYGGKCSEITVTNGEGEGAFEAHQTFEKTDLSLDGADDSFSNNVTMDGALSQSGGMLFARFGSTVVTISTSGQDPEEARQALEDTVAALN